MVDRETGDSQTQSVVALVLRVFGDDVAGVYLHGSAVLGGMRPDSDVDVFAVLARRTSEEERRTLVRELLQISAYPAGVLRPVELSIVVEGDVRPWRYPPIREFQYGEWLRDEYLRGEVPAPTPDPDLAPLITMVLLGDTPVIGPPPAQVLPEVPREDLNRALVAGVPALLDEIETDTRNVVLTLARIWTTLATGVIRSKDGAADWALDRLPAEHRPVVVRARDAYRGGGGESWDDLLPRLRPFAEHVVAEATRLAGD
ncbi:aminoglycoside adenylyltransferase family protein [Sinosporangium siamense]|uniref:Nucleotidyltransferase n=1 Tax=Sinosporangium siamense TaxID=1367973 RepID=A0A919RPM0_9ACTN|nr:aminoglycoside adenylyltransferase family protein [Sinosporangium siamense]GII96957.1 nucleotidyltransferase [Sinosporangium siamense]